MKALIIDDEALARKRVQNLLDEVQEIEVIGECSTGKMAIKQINELNGIITIFHNFQNQIQSGRLHVVRILIQNLLE